ncbi:MAG: HNH endonuclease [Anaerolineae bacterium]
MRAGDIISYRDMCDAEHVGTLQRGMNYRLGASHSVLLMSMRANAPYEDELNDDGTMLIYEGHDVSRTTDIDDPKELDQPMTTKNGKLTQNGLFFEAAKNYQAGKREAEIVHVYEKIKMGIWVFNRQFHLVDAWQASVGKRRVFKFRLQAITTPRTDKSETIQLEHTRLIPSHVKLDVWKRDNGHCVNCGSNKNLHFDHIIPFSRGGTSLDGKNIQLLCMACNLAKSNKII